MDKATLNRDILVGGQVLMSKGSQVVVIERKFRGGFELNSIQQGTSVFHSVPSDWLSAPKLEKEITKAQARKNQPVFSGVLNYFPNALKEVANCSRIGNEQHHPGAPLHWDMSKSKDEADAMLRHLIDHQNDPMDDDGVQHLAKVCWRALAMYERFLTNK